MTSGHYAGLPDAWETAAEYLPKPWRDEWIENDLRWWVDGLKMGRVKAMPTYRTLAARWGATVYTARKMVQDPGSWCDTKNLPIALSAAARVTKRAPRPSNRIKQGSHKNEQLVKVESAVSVAIQTGFAQRQTGFALTRARTSPTTLSPTTDNISDPYGSSCPDFAGTTQQQEPEHAKSTPSGEDETDGAAANGADCRADVVPKSTGVGDGPRGGADGPRNCEAGSSGVERRGGVVRDGASDRHGGAEPEPGGAQRVREGLEGIPPWIPSAKKLSPTTRHEAYEGCVRLLALLKGSEPSRKRMAAKKYGPGVKVFWLWEQLGRPPWPEFERDQSLIIRWAQKSDDKEAASEIRAEGWRDGKDRSRDVGNLFRLSPPASSSGADWHTRLELAEKWGGHNGTKPGNAASKPRPQRSVLDDLFCGGAS